MKILRTSTLIGLILITGLVLTGCGGAKEPTVVNVSLAEYSITLDQTSIPAGDIQFVIHNNGTIVHEMVLEPVGVKDKPFEANGGESEAENIAPGTTATLEWTLEPGEYHLGCYIEGHFEQGMETTFTVTN